MQRIPPLLPILLAAGPMLACGGEPAAEPVPAETSAGGEMTDEEAQELARHHPIATPEPRTALPEKSPPPPGRGAPPPGPQPTNRGAPPPLPPQTQTQTQGPTSLAPSQQPSASKSQALVVEAPPPSRPAVGRPPQPHHSHVWVPGYWYWHGGHHVWVAGLWIAPRHGHHYVGAHWVHHPHGWVFVAGGWALLGAAAVAIADWPYYHHGHWYGHRRHHRGHYGHRRYRNHRRGHLRSPRLSTGRHIRRAPRVRSSSGRARSGGRSHRSGVRVRKKRRFR